MHTCTNTPTHTPVSGVCWCICSAYQSSTHFCHLFIQLRKSPPNHHIELFLAPSCTHTHTQNFHIFFTIHLSVTCTANSKYKGHNLWGVYACVRVYITLKNEPISVKWLVIRMHWLIIASHYHLKVNGSWNQFCMRMCPCISICVCIDGIAPL